MKTNRHICLACLVGLSLVISGKLPAGHVSALEVTKSDLFNLKGWDSRQVAVHGLMLGMSKPEVQALAKRKRLVAKPEASIRPFGQVCAVQTLSGVPTAVRIFFDVQDSVDIIEILVLDPGESSPDWRKEAITNKLQGATYELVNNYSEELRLKLLGPANVVEEERNPPYHLYRQYRYLKLGLIIRVAHLHIRDGRPLPPPVLESIAFVAPSESSDVSKAP